MKTALLCLAVIVVVCVVVSEAKSYRCLTKYRCWKTSRYTVRCGRHYWTRCRRHRKYLTTCYRKCPINARMTDWSQWSAEGECSELCGGGTVTMTRTRKCYPPKYGGKKCGNTYEKKSTKCNEQPCQDIPEDWTPTNECPVLCGGATTKVNGDSKEYQDEGGCNTQPCGELCPKGQTTFHAHNFNDRLYYQCDEQQVARLRTCPDFGTWRQEYSRCVPQSCDMREGLLSEHPTDCKKYMFCLMGKRAVEMICPPGLSWNAEFKKCQKALNGEC